MKYYFKCPNCGSDEEFSRPKMESAGLGCLLFLFGGFIPALLYADATCQRVQCAECGYIFRQPPLPRTPMSTLATWIIGIIFLFGFFTFFAIAFPEIESLLPQSQVLLEIEQLISDHPRAIVLGISLMITTILLLCILVSWTSNYIAHKELRKKFETKPKRYSKMKQETPTTG